MTLTDIEQEQERAKQTVERFVRRFDPSYRLLAYHAALPLVLTPELVNYLRNKFLRSENVPWVAEVDLLLSELCSQVGYELYAMDTHVRAYLLNEIQDDPHWQRRMQEVAQVLISYVNYLSRTDPRRRPKELEAQRWAAMVYLGDESCQAAAKEIAQRLLETSSDTGSESLSESGIRAELTRLTRITEELSPQLKQIPTLLEYAKLVQRILREPETINPVELSRSYQVEGVELTTPKRVLPENLKQTVTSLVGFPPIQSFEFDLATISIEEEEDDINLPSSINLQPFTFEVATIELEQTGLLGRYTETIIHRRQQQARSFIEDLGNGVKLEMVLILEGSFLMGSPDNEPKRRSTESSQHQVTLKSFFLGKYPVTQAQWQAIAALPQISRKLNPNLSYFKGKNRPVERVSWLDAVEFCHRLSQKTGRQYRLPSEAEWEYACRAGTTTPFHFGETISPDLANYWGTDSKNLEFLGSYGRGTKRIYREATTEVGSFGVANAFGLYDMHGNVQEWCADQWYSNYEGAPTDGQAWLDNNDNQRYVVRGGSWYFLPRFCRSAYRYYYDAVSRSVNIGFRVGCAAAKTL